MEELVMCQQDYVHFFYAQLQVMATLGALAWQLVTLL